MIEDKEVMIVVSLCTAWIACFVHWMVGSVPLTVFVSFMWANIAFKIITKETD